MNSIGRKEHTSNVKSFFASKSKSHSSNEEKSSHNMNQSSQYNQVLYQVPLPEKQQSELYKTATIQIGQANQYETEVFEPN